MTKPSLSRLRVFVRALAIEAEIGVYPHERGRRQPLLIDVELDLEPTSVGAIRDTVNYETLAQRAQALAASGHIELVETFAERLGRDCLEDPQVQRVRVRIEKPQAIAGAAAAGVEIVLEASAGTLSR